MGNISFEDEPTSHAGTVGWGILAAGVVLWDVLAPETLSSAVDRALDHPIARVAAVGAVALTGAHLLNMLPDKYDPFVKAFDFLDEVRG